MQLMYNITDICTKNNNELVLILQPQWIHFNMGSILECAHEIPSIQYYYTYVDDANKTCCIQHY